MAITGLTLREARRLVNAVGREADAATRLMARRWLQAWGQLEPLWLQAAAELLSAQDSSGGRLSEFAMSRERRLRIAIERSRAAVTELAGYADEVSVQAARNAAALTAAGQPVVMASQLPPAMREQAARGYSAQTSANAVDSMVARTAQTIHSLTLPLPAVAITAMQQALVESIALGLWPNDTARTLVHRLRGQFDLSLTRATNIVRTETLDTYRRAGALVEQANADVLSGWRWVSAMDRRTCPACWSKHGTLYPTATPGPWDHQQGRCARVPELRPWSTLGIDSPEPAGPGFDSRKAFNGLPDSDKLAIMGRTRLALLNSGEIQWGDLAIRRQQPGWRDSFVATPLSVLANRGQ